MIRRRGGEGAILNSQGEFLRYHIPRLQVVEKEQTERSVDRELTVKTLREQDGRWEKGRTKKLGREAIMGPITSPVKRQGEHQIGIEEGSQRECKKKRLRTLKHDVLEEGWRELPSRQSVPLHHQQFYCCYIVISHAVKFS